MYVASNFLQHAVVSKDLESEVRFQTSSCVQEIYEHESKEVDWRSIPLDRFPGFMFPCCFKSPLERSTEPGSHFLKIWLPLFVSRSSFLSNFN